MIFLKELPSPIEIYSDIDKFVRAYAAESNKQISRYGHITVRGAFEHFLELTREFDNAGQKGRISSGGVYVFPASKPPQKGAYGAQTEWGAKIIKFTREELEALECP
jgi:hypothetical protein